jgi:hypothetical protein
MKGVEHPLTDGQAILCGVHEGFNSCAFLAVGPEGFTCLQRSTLADMLYERAQGARRAPESDFPTCQQEGRQ